MPVHTRRSDLKWYHLVFFYGILALVIAGVLAIVFWPQAVRAEPVPGGANSPTGVPGTMGAAGAASAAGTGAPVDRAGNLAVDPTKNVLDLVGALKEMLGELRKADKEILDAKLKGERDLNDARSKYDKELLSSAISRIDSESRLRSEFYTAINATEKDRVNAIRTVDTGAVAIANERANATASALAKAVTDSALVLSTQVTKSADDVRALVKTTADEQSRNLQQQFTGIQTQFTSLGTRLTALEQTGAEGKGSARFQDPALAATLAAMAAQQTKIDAQVAALATARATTTGASEGQAATWAMIVAGILLVIAILGAFVGVMNMRSRQVQK